jgi:hypothetical protein
MPMSAEEWKQRLADLERSGEPKSLLDEYEAARREAAQAWGYLSPEFRERHKAEKRAKGGELYWYGINRAADAKAKVLASVLRIKHEHV